ncbi:MAG: endolytic transglycosylase MltG [Alphaproteobacteria bacterium]|nr:endolytic transglycosylase MltG [Alphaproteobacteria bacterium]
MEFEVSPGEGLRGVAADLEEKGALNHAFLFVAGATLQGKAGQIKAGEYELPPALSPASILDKLVKGDVIRRQFTVREGLTSYEVVGIIKTVPDLSGDVASIPPEGTLLPETYSYRKDESREAKIKEMQEAMVKTLAGLCPSQPCWPAPLSSLKDVVTLASIVEKETGVPEERARVAGVFLNRLKKGIPLQTDPSVIYAITGGKNKNDGQGPLGRRLLSKDLEIDSPYNTYKYAGLPPGPIANPGKDSLEAVLHPEEHDFIYFVADGSGGHIFSKTLAEHNKNVAEWRKIRRQNRTAK